MVATLTALLAVVVCGGAVLATGLFSRLFPRPDQAMTRILFGMFVRMGVPLAFCAMVTLNGGPLADAGLVYYLLATYLVMLAVDTWLTFPRTSV